MAFRSWDSGPSSALSVLFALSGLIALFLVFLETPARADLRIDAIDASALYFDFSDDGYRPTECRLEDESGAPVEDWGACPDFNGRGQPDPGDRAEFQANYDADRPLQEYTFKVRTLGGSDNTSVIETAQRTFHLEPQTAIRGAFGGSGGPDSGFVEIDFFHGDINTGPFTNQGMAMFECRLSGPPGGPVHPWEPCSSPKGYSDMPDGDYSFEVRSVVANFFGMGQDLVDTTHRGFKFAVDGGSAGPGVGYAIDTNPPLALDDDGDGIPNEEDACPSEAGPVSNNGCPTPPPDDGEPATAPDTFIDSQQVSGDTATFQISSDQAGVTFECQLTAFSSLSSDGWQPCSSPKTYEDLRSDIYEFAVRASKDGVTDESPAMSYFEISFSVETEITSAPPATTTSQDATFEFASPTSPDATFECRLDPQGDPFDFIGSTPWSPCDSPELHEDLAEGSHRFEVRARDGGNVDSTPATHEWTINPTPPDRDGDDIPDSEDQCPDEPGPLENGGCPLPENLSPTANALVEQDQDDGRLFAFDARLSADPDGQIVAWNWEVVETGDVIGDTAQIEHRFPNETRSYRVRLTVTDDDGATDSVVVTVRVKRARQPETTVVMPSDVLFAHDSCRVRDRGRRYLRKVRRELVRDARKVELAGHASAPGTHRYNERLSRCRARAVRDLLINPLRGSHRPERVIVRWYGERRPVASNRTLRGQSKNRRVEITVRSRNR